MYFFIQRLALTIFLSKSPCGVSNSTRFKGIYILIVVNKASFWSKKCVLSNLYLLWSWQLPGAGKRPPSCLPYIIIYRLMLAPVWPQAWLVTSYASQARGIRSSHWGVLAYIRKHWVGPRNLNGNTRIVPLYAFFYFFSAEGRTIQLS